jgi:uncharacterized repeat protein (TIGR01451 family)
MGPLIKGVFRSHASKPRAILLTLGAAVLAAAPAYAVDNGPSQVGAVCMQKVFGTDVTNSNRLNCTANDIRLSKAVTVSPTTCTRGTTFDLTATFETVVTANARYDAGFFFRVDGGSNARGDGTGATGTCSLSALRAPGAPNPPALNLDGDTAGDLNAGTYNVTFTIPGVVCQDTDADTQLNLPNCTSWHSNQGTVATISDPFSSANATTFKPDTKSKCVCDDDFQVPVTVEAATVEVTKDASPISLPEPGGEVTYTVSIKNTSQVESVVISSIIDDRFGNVGTSLDADNTCDDLIGDTLAPGATATCTFKGDVWGNAGDRHTNEVTGTVTQGGDRIADKDTADVDLTDLYDAPTVQKTAQSTANCSVDASYQVVVSNNSEVDELTLNSLDDDKFGDLTSVDADVISTDCAVPQTIEIDSNYSCNFVGRINSGSETCAINHTNTVTADVTDDDGKNDQPTDDAAVSTTATP